MKRASNAANGCCALKLLRRFQTMNSTSTEINVLSGRGEKADGTAKCAFVAQHGIMCFKEARGRSCQKEVTLMD
eukprot:3802968-Amphidinium_carterae.1